MAEIKKFTVEQMEDYLHCNLFYRYKHELKLPLRGQEVENLLVKATRRMVGSWFRHLAKGKSRKAARERALKALLRAWHDVDGLDDDFPFVHAYVFSTLLRLSRNFDPSKDTAIGGAIQTGYTVLGWHIQENIDGAFLKNGRRSVEDGSKKLVAVQIVGDRHQSPGPRTIPLRTTMAKRALARAARGTGHPLKLLRIFVPSIKARWYNLAEESYDELDWLIKATAENLEAKRFLPADSMEKCNMCWYQHVCSNYFTTPEIHPAKLGQLKAASEQATREYDRARPS